MNSGKRKFATFLTGDEKWVRHRDRINEAVAEIGKAEVVALDLEFSGLFVSGKKQKTIEDYYVHCAESVPRFLAVQLGLCTARRDPEDPNKWVLSPFNFHLFPSRVGIAYQITGVDYHEQRKVFMSDSLSLSWLLHQGFDLRRWIEDGYDYKGLAYMQNDFHLREPGNERLQECGAQKLIEAIIEGQVPVVVHNGMLDLLHVFEKFISDLPPCLALFCEQMRDFFSGGIYDTKRIAEEGRTHVFRMSDTSRGATSLEALRYHLAKKKSGLRLVLNQSLRGVKAGEMVGYNLSGTNSPTSLSSVSLGGQQRPPDIIVSGSNSAPPPVVAAAAADDDANSPQQVTDKAHEAGFDAMITLQVFLLELEWLRQSGEKSPELENDNASSVIPPDWACFPFCQRVLNAVEVVGIAPGKIRLSGPVTDPESALFVNKVETDSPPPATAPPPAQIALHPGIESAGAQSDVLPPTKRFALLPRLADDRSPTVRAAPPTKPLRGRGGHYRNMQAIFHDTNSASNHLT